MSSSSELSSEELKKSNDERHLIHHPEEHRKSLAEERKSLEQERRKSIAQERRSLDAQERRSLDAQERKSLDGKKSSLEAERRKSIAKERRSFEAAERRSLDAQERKSLEKERPSLSMSRERISFSLERISFSKERRSLDGPADDERVVELKYLLRLIETDSSVENWNNLRIFAEEQVDYDFQISARLATSIVELILLHAGKRTGKTKVKLLPYTLLVVEVLYHLVRKVNQIQDAVEALQTTQLSKARLGNHITHRDENHSLLSVKLFLFISQNFRKFSDPTTYISNWNEVKKIVDPLKEELKADTPFLPPSRLSMEGRLSVQTSYIDIDPEVALEILGVDKRVGLDIGEVKRRQAEYGLNLLPVPPPPSILWMILGQLKDFMTIVLFVVSIAAFAISDYKAGGVLLAVIVINVIIGFTQEYKAEKALSGMIKLETPQAKVIREGETIVVDASDLTPGDIVVLEEGDQIPADLRLFEVADLHIIEAVLTGESEPIEKKTAPIRKKNIPLGDRKNMAFMTTSVTKGRGKGVVVMIGVRTEAGKIAEDLKTAKQPTTPLQKRLDRLGKILVVAAVVLCGLIIGIGAAWGRDIVEMVKLAITLGAAVIPEGLVTVTTVTMAIGVQRMAKKRAIIRKLSAVETLGSVSVICSDKTGTLTEGKMKVVNLWTGNTNYVLSGNPLKEAGGQMARKRDNEVITHSDIDNNFHLLQSSLILALCNNASYKPSKEGEGYDTMGDPTEIACMLCAMTGGYDPKELNKEVDGESEWTRLKEFVFDSNRKRMSVVYRSGKKNYFTYAKGGVESILSICTHQNLSGEEVELNKALQKKVEKKAMNFAKEGLRVLALAYKVHKGKKILQDIDKIDSIENGLVFVGLVGIIDPERPEVKEAIRRCQEAGIKVCMITGDHQSTAKAIAIKLGISKKDEKPLRGVDIDILVNTNQLDTLDPWPSVFARVSPENKLQIVQTLQKRKRVVAMTGDGVNDAPAIKNADCGVAMGIAGTDITKQVASIILRDDNFETIARAVEEGRIIYDNIQKFILYILSCNSAEIFTAIICIAANGPAPFNTMQILWANIIADVPSAMALGIDAPELEVMKRPPRKSKSHILNPITATILLLNSLSMALLCVAVLFIAVYVEGYPKDPNEQGKSRANTLAFVSLTTSQIFHGFIARSKSTSVFRINPLTNLWMLGAVFGSFSLLVMSVYAPYVNDFFAMTTLNGMDWAHIFAALGAHILITEIIKAFYRLYRSRKARNKQTQNVVLEEVEI